MTQEMVNQLEPGMTKEQVRFILGTPLIKDSFNQNHWIYLNTVTDARSQKKEKRLDLVSISRSTLSLVSAPCETRGSALRSQHVALPVRILSRAVQ